MPRRARLISRKDNGDTIRSMLDDVVVVRYISTFWAQISSTAPAPVTQRLTVAKIQDDQLLNSLKSRSTMNPRRNSLKRGIDEPVNPAGKGPVNSMGVSADLKDANINAQFNDCESWLATYAKQRGDAVRSRIADHAVRRRHIKQNKDIIQYVCISSDFLSAEVDAV